MSIDAIRCAFVLYKKTKKDRFNKDHTCNCHKQTIETVTLMILCLCFYSCIKKPVFDVLHNVCKRSYSLKDYEEVKDNLLVDLNPAHSSQLSQVLPPDYRALV